MRKRPLTAMLTVLAALAASFAIAACGGKESTGKESTSTKTTTSSTISKKPESKDKGY